VLRYAAFAMVLHDKNFIYDKLVVWLCTIMYALCTPEHVALGYRTLIAACRSHLAPPDAEAIVPYVEIVLSEFESYRGKPS